MVDVRSNLTPTQRYAAGALLAIALNQAQINQTQPLGIPSSEEDDDGEGRSGDRRSNSSSGDSVSDDPSLWVHEKSGLLRPVFRCLDIDSSAWLGLEETANYSPAKHHIGAYTRLLSEEASDASVEMVEQEVALAKAADAMVQSFQSSESIDAKLEKHQEYENECREIYGVPEVKSKDKDKDKKDSAETESLEAGVVIRDGSHNPEVIEDDKSVMEETLLSHQRKINVLYELLSACLSDKHQEVKKCTRRRKGYDARHRLALRLLATWFNIEWIKVEAIETIVACSAMALQKSAEMKGEDALSPTSSWAKWKRGGIIGAAALTGGALMAITGGLAAPAIAAGFGALAPTLGTLIPVIGAGGFAAAASAAGTVAGSVAVAASFGAAGAGLTGTKMARRIGDLDEFEFKAIGENHNQGRLAVEVLVAGVVFKEEDFVKPWEGLTSSLERYTLQWESKNLILVSTAIQDWLTSRLAMELMKQGAMHTVLSSLLLALAWPATILVAADFIDSKWSIAIDRSDKAGRLLAEVLQKGLQGNRPITLVGFSLGARVIFKCLQTLAETEQNAELVERVVILGAPISINNENWRDVRKMVAGRFINVYATNDWTLGVAFRASLFSQGLAGIQPICIPGIENVDVTDMVEGHASYLWKTQQILERLEIDTYYPVFRNTL
ncbi:unnamed protein product [Cochlearia groenlandica]